MCFDISVSETYNWNTFYKEDKIDNGSFSFSIDQKNRTKFKKELESSSIIFSLCLEVRFEKRIFLLVFFSSLFFLFSGKNVDGRQWRARIEKALEKESRKMNNKNWKCLDMTQKKKCVLCCVSLLHLLFGYFKSNVV